MHVILSSYTKSYAAVCVRLSNFTHLCLESLPPPQKIKNNNNNNTNNKNNNNTNNNNKKLGI